MVASAAKAAGIAIYVIGLSGNGGIDETALRQWASQPDSEYVSISPSDAEQEELDVSGDAARLCNERNFRVRFISNYIDAGFTCCTPDD